MDVASRKYYALSIKLIKSSDFSEPSIKYGHFRSEIACKQRDVELNQLENSSSESAVYLWDKCELLDWWENS